MAVAEQGSESRALSLPVEIHPPSSFVLPGFPFTKQERSIQINLRPVYLHDSHPGLASLESSYDVGQEDSYVSFPQPVTM